MPFKMNSNPRDVKVPIELEACLSSLFFLGVQESTEINSSECEINCCNLVYTNTQTRQAQAILKLGII